MPDRNSQNEQGFSKNDFINSKPPQNPYEQDSIGDSNYESRNYNSEYNQNQQNYNRNFNTGNSGFDVPPKPNNSLPLAIVGTILALCTSCVGVITGIIAIVYAMQVDSKYAVGDYYGAEDAAQIAKTMGIVTMVLNALVILIGVIYFIVMGATLWSGYY